MNSTLHSVVEWTWGYWCSTRWGTKTPNYRAKHPISEKWNVQYITFRSKWSANKVGVHVWSFIAAIYPSIYKQDHDWPETEYACAKARGKQSCAPELSPFWVTSRTPNFMRTLELFYEWLFYVIPLVKRVFIYSTGCFCNFTCWDFGGWGDCSQPCPRSTLRHRPRCDKHSVTNPTRLIAIN